MGFFFKVYETAQWGKGWGVGWGERIPSRLCVANAEPDVGLELTKL